MGMLLEIRGHWDGEAVDISYEDHRNRAHTKVQQQCIKLYAIVPYSYI